MVRLVTDGTSAWVHQSNALRYSKWELSSVIAVVFSEYKNWKTAFACSITKCNQTLAQRIKSKLKNYIVLHQILARFIYLLKHCLRIARNKILFMDPTLPGVWNIPEDAVLPIDHNHRNNSKLPLKEPCQCQYKLFLNATDPTHRQ